MIKKIINSVLLACAMMACQTIPEADRLIPVESAEPVSNALLVEFTGFRCVNCPKAAEEAHNLLETYGDRLVVVAMHPKTNSFCQTTNAAYDLTCPLADEYYLAHDGSKSTPFPTGVIDGTSGLTDYTGWGAAIHHSVHTEKAGKLLLTVEAISSSEVRTTFETEIEDMQLDLWLVEDSIVAPQLMPDGTQNMTYVHNHVLRGPLQLGLNHLPDSVNGIPVRPQHCSVVGVLSRNQQVVDVKQYPIMN